MSAPNREALSRLKQSLPGMIQKLEQGRVLHGGRPASKSCARKCCQVCGKLFDFAILQSQPLPELGICSSCQQTLDDGWTALVCADHYAFVKSKALADDAGKVLQISLDLMQQVKDRHMLDWSERKKNEGNGKPEKPD